MAHHIFISHSSKDKPIADAICAAIEYTGIRCWIAPRDIAPGEDWPAAISRGISQSRVMVLVFSSHSNSSDDVGRELFLADNCKLIIIPFRIENIEPEPGKQFYLARRHWLDASNPPLEKQIQNLVHFVEMLVPRRVIEGSFMKHDPIEDDPRYKSIFEAAEKDTEAEFADDKYRGLGFCGSFWAAKKRILKTKYGIDWKTPAEMNPDTLYD